MVTPDNVRTYIAAGLPCEHLSVTGDGQHFEALIVATAFEGKRLIQRHQLVYKALGDRMREEIHALSMRTLTPAEFAEQFPGEQPVASATGSSSASETGSPSASEPPSEAPKLPSRGKPLSIPIKGV